ncbi:MAG: serine hydrolase [Thermomicrobium sp.]|nr:serine hydrolase [Thermomicrobium sp.]
MNVSLPSIRRFGIGLLLLALSITIAGITLARYDPAKPAAPIPTATSSPTPAPSPTPTPTPTPTPPPLSARAAVVIDVTDDQVLLDHQGELPLPPASTLKLLTALTARAILQPEEVVTIQPEDIVDPTAESAMGLLPGDMVTVHDLLIGLLLPSGNDAARALARIAGERLATPNVGAPSERFLHAMRDKAKNLGLGQTIVRTPDGDDVPGQVTSAHDLARLARAVLADPELAAIVAMREARVRLGGAQARVLDLTNTNELLGQLGVVGVKTGTTPAAGQCLVAAWRTRDERLYLAVVLGSQDRYADVRALIDWVAVTTGSAPVP